MAKMFRNDETYVYAITHWPHFHAFISIEYWEKFVHAQAKWAGLTLGWCDLGRVA